jgi:hypothetical protein
MLMSALIAMAMTTKYLNDEAEVPERQKAILNGSYPEITCDNAEFKVVVWGDAGTVIDIRADKACIDSIRRAVVHRGFKKGSPQLERVLKDGYWWRGQSNSTVMFDFRSDGRAVKWIRD